MNKVNNPKQTESDTKNIDLEENDNKIELKPPIYDLDEIEKLDDGKDDNKVNSDLDNPKK